MRKIILVSLTLNLIFMSACSKSDPNLKMPAVEHQVVTVTKPKYESYTVTLHANGLIEPWQEMTIGAEIGGLDISNVYVNVGDKVKKGQLLAELNDAQITADYLSQKASVAEAEANLTQARTEAEQATTLARTGAISSQDLLQYSTKAKTSQAQLAAAKANLDLQKLKLSYTKIIAPDDGVIASRSAALGSIVSSGSELFRLIRNNRLEWQAEIALNQVQDIESGQAVVIQTPENKTLHGVVRQISPSLNINSKNVVAYVDIPQDQKLKIGSAVDGVISLGLRQGLLIPFASIVNSDGFTYVMKLDAKNRVHKTKIVIGNIIGDKVVVLSGLTSEEMIVVNGASFLNESDIVSVVEG